MTDAERRSRRKAERGGRDARAREEERSGIATATHAHATNERRCFQNLTTVLSTVSDYLSEVHSALHCTASVAPHAPFARIGPTRGKLRNSAE